MTLHIRPAKTLTDRINESGLKRYFIADKVGVSKVQLWKWERGVSIHSVDHVSKLSRLLGCLPEDVAPELRLPEQ